MSSVLCDVGCTFVEPKGSQCLLHWPFNLILVHFVNLGALFFGVRSAEIVVPAGCRFAFRHEPIAWGYCLNQR